MRVSASVTSPIALTSPASPPAILMLAFRPTGSRHAIVLAAHSTRLSARPAVIMPQSPSASAIQRVLPGWLKAARICLATPPERPPASVTSLPLKKFDARLASPTMNKRNGTKNKKSRNAIALAMSEPCDSRSWCQIPSPKPTRGRSS